MVTRDHFYLSLVGKIGPDHLFQHPLKGKSTDFENIKILQFLKTLRICESKILKLSL